MDKHFEELRKGCGEIKRIDGQGIACGELFDNGEEYICKKCQTEQRIKDLEEVLIRINESIYSSALRQIDKHISDIELYRVRKDLEEFKVELTKKISELKQEMKE